MSLSSNLGNGVILAGTTAAGVYAGKHMGNKCVNNEITKLGTEGEYVQRRIAANFDNLQAIKSKRIKTKMYKSVGDKAVEDFKKLQERVLKEANKTKNKWILGLGVAGLALGALIVKLKSDKN